MPDSAQLRSDVEASVSAHQEADLALAIERFPRSRLAAEVRRLSRVDGWRTSRIIVRVWALILAAGALAIWSGSPWVYLLAMVVIATQQQTLGVLVHDGAHWLLYRNRTVNDVVCDLCMAFPLAMSTTLYRETHFRHHRFTNSPQDPDVAFQRDDTDWTTWPKTRWGCAWLLMKNLMGLNLHKASRAVRQWSPWMNLFAPLGPAYPLRARLLLVVSTVAIYAAVIGAGVLLPAILLWAVPSLTLVNLVNRLRATAEHFQTRGTHELNATRTVIPNWLERLFVSPLGVNYHLEHHLYPSVPCCDLGQLHAALMQDEQFRRRAHITNTYAGVLHEWMTPRTDRAD